MTVTPGPLAVVVTDDPALMASLPFHCSVALSFDPDQAARAAVVLVDVRPTQDPDEVLAALGDVDVNGVVMLASRPPQDTRVRVLLRPVSVSLVGRVVEQLATGVRDEGPAPAVPPPAPAAAETGAGPAESVEGPGRFVQELLRATAAARSLREVLTSYPALARPAGIVGEVAIEAAEAGRLGMLGIWHRVEEQYRCLGGVALRPSDARRQVDDEHALVARAHADGGVVVGRVADDPAAVSGLPGAYEESILLLPLVTDGGNQLLVVGGGTELGVQALDVVEEALSASATVIDLAIALDGLLAALEA